MKVILVTVILCCACPTAWSQVGIHVFPTELSVPFGTAAGKLVAVGDMLVFVDDQKPEASFALSRSDVQSLTGEGKTITVQTAQPLQIPSGRTSTFTFRLRDDDAGFLTQWQHTAGAPARGSGTAVEPVSLEAKHNHRVGSCRGRLIITGTGLSYESIDQISDSRQWDLKDIKELRRDNPYKLKIQPFNGGDYDLEIQGQGMDNAQFKLLVDRITAARVAR